MCIFKSIINNNFKSIINILLVVFSSNVFETESFFEAALFMSSEVVYTIRCIITH